MSFSPHLNPVLSSFSNIFRPPQNCLQQVDIAMKLCAFPLSASIVLDEPIHIFSVADIIMTTTWVELFCDEFHEYGRVIQACKTTPEPHPCNNLSSAQVLRIMKYHFWNGIRRNFDMELFATVTTSRWRLVSCKWQTKAHKWSFNFGFKLKYTCWRNDSSHPSAVDSHCHKLLYFSRIQKAQKGLRANVSIKSH